jgi:hypothetical protein
MGGGCDGDVLDDLVSLFLAAWPPDESTIFDVAQEVRSANVLPKRGDELKVGVFPQLPPSAHLIRFQTRVQDTNQSLRINVFHRQADDQGSILSTPTGVLLTRQPILQIKRSLTTAAMHLPRCCPFEMHCHCLCCLASASYCNRVLELHSICP